MITITFMDRTSFEIYNQLYSDYLEFKEIFKDFPEYPVKQISFKYLGDNEDRVKKLKLWEK